MSRGSQWYKEHPEARKAETQRIYHKTAWAPVHMAKWTEDETLAVVWKGVEETDAMLSKRLGRSVGSIQRKRVRLRREGRI